MARARNIKPGFFKNEDLAECSPWARLCFAGLWILADREGRLEDRPKRIKGELFPYDTVDVEPLLQELVRFNFILRYEIEGFKAIQILEFAKHQSPHYSESQSVIKSPELPEPSLHHEDRNPGGLPEDSRNPPGIKRGSQPPDSLIPDSLIQKPPSAGADKPPAGFVRFWQIWPSTDRKTAKSECAKRWKARGLEATADEIAAHVEAMKTTRKWREGFEPAPLTYLNQRHWEDGLPPADSPGTGWTAGLDLETSL